MLLVVVAGCSLQIENRNSLDNRNSIRKSLAGCCCCCCCWLPLLLLAATVNSGVQQQLSMMDPGLFWSPRANDAPSMPPAVLVDTTSTINVTVRRTRQCTRSLLLLLLLLLLLFEIWLISINHQRHGETNPAEIESLLDVLN